MDITVKMGPKDAKKLTLRQLFAVQNGDMQSMLDILSHFIYVGENHLPPEQGKDALLDLTIEELEEVLRALQGAIQDGAVPPVNATSLNSQ